LIATALSAVLAPAPLGAMEREVRVRLRNSSSAPVFVRTSKAKVVEMVAAPTANDASPDQVNWSRVRYANRKGRELLQWFLQGESTLVNRSEQPVTVVNLTVMAQDAFQQPVGSGVGAPFEMHQVEVQLRPGASESVAWEQPVSSEKVYEAAIAVVATRYEDGAIWAAPKSFVQETFFPGPGYTQP
jgi:hypothetical protein